MKKLSCILLIDDDVPSNFYNQRIIEQNGCAEHIEAYSNAQDGLNFLQSKFTTALPPQPELVFLDINLPGMDGWDFLDAYHQLPFEKKKDVLIVMLTTSVNPSDKKKALEKGINQFITKPLTTQVLNKLIEDHF